MLFLGAIAALFYAALRWFPLDSRHDIPTLLIICLLVLLLTAFTRSAPSQWILLITFLVPFDFSRKLGFFPAFSPNDYFCGIALLALLLKVPWNTLYQELRRLMGKWGIFFWLSFFVYSLISAYMLHGNLRHTTRWFAFLVCYCLAAFSCEKDARSACLARLPGLISVLGGGIGAAALFQYWASHGNYEAVIVTFKQHNPVGMFLSLCLPSSYFWSQRGLGARRSLRAVIVALALGGFLVSYSRGAWAGLTVGALTAWWIHRGHTTRLAAISLVAVFFLGIAAMIYFNPRVGLTGRRVYWAAATRVIKTHPWVGLGPGNYASHIESYLSKQDSDLYQNMKVYDPHPDLWLHLHNLYLQILVEYGLVGAGFLFAGLGILVFKALKPHPVNEIQIGFQISVVAFLVHNFFDILTINSFDYLFAIFLALSAFPLLMSNVGTTP